MSLSISCSWVHLWVWRWWKPFQFYAGFNIVLLYLYQLPVEFPDMLRWVADFIGLFKITLGSQWTEVCSSVSLILFYIMVCLCFKTSINPARFNIAGYLWTASASYVLRVYHVITQLLDDVAILFELFEMKCSSTKTIDLNWISNHATLDYVHQRILLNLPNVCDVIPSTLLHMCFSF